MSTAQQSLWDGARLQMTESIELTIASIQAYGARFEHWAVAWSGGKDSTTLLTFIVWAILARKVRPPKSLTVLYADTRMEILPLWFAAASIRDELEDKREALDARGVELRVRTVMAPLDHRFFVYMLGRGVPPPNNRFRWCTQKLKIDPMIEALEELAVELGLGAMVDGKYQGRGAEKLLMLTGVRIGESAARDQRIALSCGRDGAECGQGWYQEATPEALAGTLSPLLHWRVCHAWEWLRTWAPRAEYGDWSTEIIAEAYGGEEAEEINARTGCYACNLVEEDRALSTVARMEAWTYLAPLKRLKQLWTELLKPPVRLRKRGGERTKAGKLAAKQQRLGPLTFEARRMALARVLAIQNEVNEEARRRGRPEVDVLNAEEVARIEELIEAQTWPEKWSGDEPTGDIELPAFYADGTMQPLLFDAVGGGR